jgi:hypothetical protein
LENTCGVKIIAKSFSSLNNWSCWQNISKDAMHYSPEMTIMSYRIRTSSTVAYKILLEENILCLPSLITLSKVTRRMNTSRGLNNSA